MIPAGFECPNCGNALAKRATYCGCGWTKERKQKGFQQGKSEGIGQCAWLANGEQCHYPGTTSHNMQGLGPWYCRFHAMPDISQHYGEQIVQESRSYRKITIAERDAQYLERRKDASHQPKSKACEELRCLREGALQQNGRYLCHRHKYGDVEYAKRGPRRGMEMPQLALPREPGADDEDFSAAASEVA